MKDIHSIGQAFKIVSEKGTAKRKTSKLITDGDSTIRGSITSQEFPYFDKWIEEIVIPEIKRETRAEMIKEIERIVDEYFKSQFPEDTGLRDAIIDKIKQLEKEENK